MSEEPEVMTSAETVQQVEPAFVDPSAAADSAPEQSLEAKDDAQSPQQASDAVETSPHPADSILQRIENEVDGLLHSPLALAGWVKDMVREARTLL